jgi:hypothetical protein
MGAALSSLNVAAERERPVLRFVAVGTVAVVLTAAGLARVPFYRGLQQSMATGEPKSGIRTVCREMQVRANELLIAAPDYLAPTVWYYCGSESRIKGYVRWNDAVRMDLRQYAREWTSPDALQRTLGAIEKYLSSSGQRRLNLIWDPNWDGPPLFFLRRVSRLKEALESRYRVMAEQISPGRVEEVGFLALEADPTSANGVARTGGKTP